MSDNNLANNDNQNNTSINSWEDLDIKRSLLRGIYAYGFENPSIKALSLIRT